MLRIITQPPYRALGNNVGNVSFRRRRGNLVAEHAIVLAGAFAYEESRSPAADRPRDE
jgi:hypothetical protein